MKYKTPELTLLTPAINAVQGAVGTKLINAPPSDGLGDNPNESVAGYVDWE
jgi:hypothetical protein